MTDCADVEKKWSILNPSLGARTIEENITLYKLPKSKKEYNVSNPPLFPTIPLTKVVIDNLHLFYEFQMCLSIVSLYSFRC